MVLEKVDYHTLKVIKRNSEMPNANTQECIREQNHCSYCTLNILYSMYSVDRHLHASRILWF
jgi:hypothetical protein